MSIPPRHHQTIEFKQLISHIREYFEAKKIPVYEKPRETLNTLLGTGQRKTKKELMQALTLQFPQLTLCYHKEIKNKKRYYIKVFEAVGVAALK